MNEFEESTKGKKECKSTADIETAAASALVVPAKPPSRKRETNLCIAWVRHGNCRFGDRCKYSHEGRPGRNPMYKVKRDELEAMFAGSGQNNYQNDGRQQYRKNNRDIRPRYQPTASGNQYNNHQRQQQQGGRPQQQQPPRQGGYMMAQYAPKYCELADDSPTYGGVAWIMNDTFDLNTNADFNSNHDSGKPGNTPCNRVVPTQLP